MSNCEECGAKFELPAETLCENCHENYSAEVCETYLLFQNKVKDLEEKLAVAEAFLDTASLNLKEYDPEFVWVVPPPIQGGRNPCIGVYQKVIRFQYYRW